MSQPATRMREDTELSRTHILDDAIRMISERGYQKFAVQELAERCGMSLLYHFRTREELLLAVLDECDWRDAAYFANAKSGVPQEVDQIVLSQGEMLTLFRLIVARRAVQPEITRLRFAVQAEAQNPEHPAFSYFQAREANLLREFETMARPHARDARSIARRILAAMEGLERQWLAAGGNFDMVAEWDRTAMLFFPQTSQQKI